MVDNTSIPDNKAIRVLGQPPQITYHLQVCRSLHACMAEP
jgi:hypothetical protein